MEQLVILLTMTAAVTGGQGAAPTAEALARQSNVDQVAQVLERRLFSEWQRKRAGELFTVTKIVTERRLLYEWSF